MIKNYTKSLLIVMFSLALLCATAAVSFANGTESAPRILIQPQNATANERSSFDFSVSAQGDGLKYRWEYSEDAGETWVNCTSAVGKLIRTPYLRINAKFGNDKKLFRCVVSNSYGSVVTDAVHGTIDNNLPSVTDFRSNTVVDLGERASFSVTAKGGELRYQWQYSADEGATWKDSAAAAAKAPDFSIAGSVANASLLYRCVVSNEYGATYAGYHKVVVITNPRDTTVKSGETVCFSAICSGAAASYKWEYSPNRGVYWYDCTEATAHDAELKVAGTRDNAAKQYRCEISDGQSVHIMTKTVHFTISDDKPSIYGQTACPIVAAGERALFTAQASGSGLTYQWQYSTDGGKTWKNSTSSTANDATLNIAGSAANAKLLYRCVVANAYGSVVTNTAQIKFINKSCVIDWQPQDQKAAKGGFAVFSVKGIPDIDLQAGVMYQWQYSADKGATWKNVTSPGAGRSSLNVTVSAENATFLYRCVVSNGIGSVVSNRVRVILQGNAPAITTQPKDVLVGAGERAIFTVKAEGDELSYLWQYSPDSGARWIKSTSSTANAATLNIAGSAANAKLLYRCVVDNPAGSVITQTVRVTLRGSAPTVTAQPADAAVNVGDRAIFTVKAEEGDLTYQWQYSGNNGETWKNSTSGSAKKATLNIAGSAANAKLLYRCVISNASGSVTTQTVRVVLNPPVILVQPTDASVEPGKAAYFSVQAGGGKNITYQWQYSADGKAWKNVTGSSTYAGLEIPGGKVNEKYWYRCVVANEGGTVTTQAVRVIVLNPEPIDPEAVILTAQPTDASVRSDDYADFVMKATGFDLSFSWQYSADGGETWSYVGSLNADFTERYSVNGGQTWIDDYPPSVNAARLRIRANASTAAVLYRGAVANEYGTVVYTDPVGIHLT